MESKSLYAVDIILENIGLNHTFERLTTGFYKYYLL